MKKKLVSLIVATSLITAMFSTKVTYAESIGVKELNNLGTIDVANKLIDNQSIENSYFHFNNIWGGNALRIIFDQSTMKINATSMSGNFSNAENNFVIKIIEKSTGEARITAEADSKFVKDFIPKINDSDFKYGDIISLKVNSSSGLAAPKLFTGGTTTNTNCRDKIQYFEITETGIKDYVPNIEVDPLKILGMGAVTKATVKGKSSPGNRISVLVNGNTFTGTTNDKGIFSIDITSQSELVASTSIKISLGELSVNIYPEILSNSNMSQETNTGIKYMLNADIEYLTKPFEFENDYVKSILSDEGQKAWDLAYRTLLAYDNSDDSHKRDSAGNTIVYIDYEAANINIDDTQASYVQTYLVKNSPRMFHLKDWRASPVKKNGKIIGQNFYIGNGGQNGNQYKLHLLSTEKTTSEILSKIEPDMSIYEVIKTIQINFESAVNYQNAGRPGDMIGALTNRQAICGGFSKGYEYLLQRVGIDNIWVTGQAGGYHAWNHINIYGNWYLADTTWGGKNWYLNGANSPFTQGRVIGNTYHKMPGLAEDSIPWELGNKDQKSAKFNGVVNYKDNNTDSVTITYEDKENLNTSMTINTNVNNYEPVEMTKDNNGMWSATVPYKSIDNGKSFNFYFSVNGKYYTAGNIKKNNMATKIFEDGMNNIVLNFEDVNNDNKVDILDIAKVSSAYNSVGGNGTFEKGLDVNRDNIIDIYDIIRISRIIE